MEIDPVNKAIVGGFFVVAGLVMLFLRKDLQAFHEELFAGLVQYWPHFIPRGRVLTVFIIVFGVMSIIGGSLVVLLALSV